NIMDNFERALAVELSPDTMSNFKKGVEMIANEIRSLLSRHGVSDLPCLGAPFDPNIHEALASETTNEQPEGTIVRVHRKPYKYHDKLIRPGQVVVAKKP
ncbi:MAG: nucleotide exchange factor GrpE, partial [Bdellovibrionaceae bacterium]|nr:nucleotide exchange factor GrpE [Pseudobdellovibrionaceae bacterium]